MAKSTAMIKADEWEWTEERERCFQMKLRGFPNLQIAEELEVHRNTISAWTKHPTFARRMQEELEEFAASSRLRRVRTTTVFTDRVSRLAEKALKTVEKNPKSGRGLSRLRALLGEFRAMRNEERLNYGDSTENHTFNGSLHHSGQVQTLSSTAFKQYLRQGIENGEINAQLIAQAGGKKAAIVEAVQQMLVNGDVIRQLDKESGTTDPTQEAIDAEYSVVHDTADEEAQQAPEFVEEGA